MKRGRYGKLMLIVELFLVFLISISGLYLAYLAILHSYVGALPWITAMIAPAWMAYGASKTSYNNKTMKESLPYIEAEIGSQRDA